MTKEAFETIKEGLQDALAVARGEAELYRLHERGGYTMTPAEYTHYILSQRELIRDLANALEDCRRALSGYLPPQSHGEFIDHEIDVAKLLIEQARKELQ